MDIDRLKAQLELEEGTPQRTYLDTKGILSGGVGHNLVAHPEHGYDRVGILVPPEVSKKWFEQDLQRVINDLNHNLPWWTQLDPVRQNIVADMTFNMGIGGLMTFANTLANIKNGHYDAAADGMKASLWHTQVGTRAIRLEKMMRTGQWPADIPEVS